MNMTVELLQSFDMDGLYLLGRFCWRGRVAPKHCASSGTRHARSAGDGGLAYKGTGYSRSA